MNFKDLASTIDHTCLKPEATQQEIQKLCEEAATHRFAAVCVNPFWLPTASSALEGSGVKLCTVVGFPLGASQSSIKFYETEKAIKAGAHEIDMVINIGALKQRNLEVVADEISVISDLCHKSKTLCKVIVETCLLTEEEKKIVCNLVQQGDADFIKTSTGFSKSGAHLEDIRLFRSLLLPKTGIKASGGIKDLATAKAMLEAGANRLGMSASVSVMAELKE